MAAGSRRQVHILVEPDWFSSAKAKADGYGITLTDLVKRSVEAYVRVWDDAGAPCSLVAVNYALWSRADSELALCRAHMGVAARSLNSLRASLASARRDGGVGAGAVARCEARLGAVESELRSALSSVRACESALDAVAGRTNLVDPWAAAGASGEGSGPCRFSSR